MDWMWGMKGGELRMTSLECLLELRVEQQRWGGLRAWETGK